MLSFLVSLLMFLAPVAHAQTSDVQSQIDATSAQIQQLKNEIARLQSELNATSAQKQTLQNAINALNLNIKKTTASITLTNAQINQKDKEIRRLSGGISTTTSEIGDVRGQIGDSLNQLRALDDEPPALALLSKDSTLSSLFDEAAALANLRTSLQMRVQELSELKGTLVSSKNSAEQKRTELARLQADLAQQKKSLTIAKDTQNQLLAETKNKESSYQAQIAQKKAEEASFEEALIRLAQGLGSADTGSAPAPRRGILNWPLDSVAVTQHFGKTSFSQSGGYSGQGHNGIDFRAPIGTPVRSVLGGTVQETNQGAVKNCQYGKWVLVRHDNGLTSLYAHLSNIAVSKGERVSTGGLVGYSGDTGYATGPHLHLTLYVSSAVTFKNYTCNSGKSAYIPIAPLNAYLNPVSYLP